MRRVIGLGLLVSAVLGVNLGAEASHSWNGYHWGRASNPFTLRMVDSVVGRWDPLLRAVSSDWSASSVLDTRIQSGQTALLTRRNCPAISGKIHVCNANYGPNLWFGIARIWLRDGHIYQAITKVNDYHYTGTYGNDTARRHVLCQEVGHAFGLGHHRQASCMDDTNSTLNNPSYLQPNSHDYEQLQSIYAHRDSVTTTRQSAQTRLPDSVERVGKDTILTFVFWVR